jgi:hypothetical protein
VSPPSQRLHLLAYHPELTLGPAQPLDVTGQRLEDSHSVPECFFNEPWKRNILMLRGPSISPNPVYPDRRAILPSTTSRTHHHVIVMPPLRLSSHGRTLLDRFSSLFHPSLHAMRKARQSDPALCSGPETGHALHEMVKVPRCKSVIQY